MDTRDRVKSFLKGKELAADRFSAIKDSISRGEIAASEAEKSLFNFTMGPGWDITDEGRGYICEAMRLTACAGETI